MLDCYSTVYMHVFENQFFFHRLIRQIFAFNIHMYYMIYGWPNCSISVKVFITSSRMVSDTARTPAPLPHLKFFTGLLHELNSYRSTTLENQCINKIRSIK